MRRRPDEAQLRRRIRLACRRTGRATPPTRPAPPVTATGLPAGLKLDPTSGVISGVPTTTGTYAAFLTAHGARGDLGATVGFVVWPDAQKAGIPVGAFAIRAVELLNLLHRAPWLLFHHDGKVMPCVVAKTEADIRRFIETHDGHANSTTC